MSTCARCGLQRGVIGYPVTFSEPDCCYADSVETRDELHSAIVECRDRELANLRSLLRQATRRLENAVALLDDIHEPCSIRAEIDAVLELLS